MRFCLKARAASRKNVQGKIASERRMRFRKIASAVVCFGLAVFSLTAGICEFSKSNDFFHNLTLRAEGDGFDSEWLKSELEFSEETEDVEEEENFSFAAWTELKNESVLVEWNGKSCESDVIAVYGSSHCLFPVGKNLSVWDTDGCIIGEGLAETLFADRQAEGQNLVWRGRDWVVRGVVKEPADLLIVQAAGIAQELSFDRISIALPKNGEGTSLTGMNGGIQETDRQLTGEAFMNRYGLSARVLRWDYLTGFSWLKELIPGKWSDFDGWKQNLDQYKKARELLKSTEKSAVETAGLNARNKGQIFLFLGAVLCAAGGCVCVKKRVFH